MSSNITSNNSAALLFRLLLEDLCLGDRKYFYYRIDYTDSIPRGQEFSLLRRIHNTSDKTTCEDPLLHFAEHRMSKQLLLYVPPILIVLGTLGNIFSFLILCRRSMRKFSTYIYLAVLGIADTLVLHVGLLRLWVAQLTGYDVRDTADWLCKVVNFAGYTVSDYSVWLIIAVTVERYIVVANPFRAATYCTNRRAMFVVVLILVIMFFINIHIFWTVQLTSENGKAKCQGGPGHEYFVEYILPWIDAILYSLAPFLLILVLNALIIWKVLQARRSRKKLQSGSIYSDQRRCVQGESGYKLTVMLLWISFSFLITTLPMNITSIAIRFWNKYSDDLSLMAKFSLVRTVTELLMYINHSINFIIYCVTGHKFRQQLLWMLCRRVPALSHSVMSEYTHIPKRKEEKTKGSNGNLMQNESRELTRKFPMTQV